MFSGDKILMKIRRHSDRLKLYGVESVGLFGSFVTSSQHVDSDIDILVQFRPGKKNFDNYMDLKFFLEKLFHKKIDLVIKEALKNRIKNKVLSEVQYA